MSAVRSNRPDALIAGALFLLALATFLPSLGNDFVNLDDALYVYQNDLVQGGLTPEGIARAFTGPACNFYHPLTMLSLMLDHQLWGLNPAGFRLTNLLLHAATAAILFLLLRLMTGQRWPSAFVAAVFAVHPLRVESVVWIAERKDVLSAFFYLLTLLIYAWYARRPFHPARYALLLAAFVVGLLCKTTLVTVPGVMLLLDFWPIRRAAADWRRIALEKVPLILLALVATVLAAHAQKSGTISYADYPLDARLGNAALSCVIYAVQTVAPLGLAPFYPFPSPFNSPAAITAAVLLLLGLTAVALRLIPKAPYVAVGWFWYLGVLVPMLGLIQIGTFSRADRFTYLPQIGLLIILAWGAADLVRLRRLSPLIAAGAALGIIAASAIASVRQSRHWKDSETLFRHTLAVTRDNDLAAANLAVAILEPRRHGRLVREPLSDERRNEAVQHLREAVRLRPEHPDKHLNLGLQLAALGERREAIDHLTIALRTFTWHGPGQFTLGTLLFEQGDIPAALPHLARAVEIEPDNFVARNAFAAAHRRLGNFAEAIAQYRLILAQRPDYADAYNNLAIALYSAGAHAEALAAIQKAVQLAPDNAQFRRNLEAIQR